MKGEPMTTELAPSPPNTTGRANKLLWLASAFLALVFIGAGVLKFTSSQVADMFANWGYTSWFRMLVGIVEVGSGILILVPRLAMYAGAFLAVVMGGAVVTHLKFQQSVQAAIPGVLMLIALSVAYMRRPRNASWRTWIPPAILLLSAGLIGPLQLDDELEKSLRFMYSFETVGLTILLLGLWLLLLSGLRWRTRLIGTGAGIAPLVSLGVGLGLAVRVDGSVSGDGVPMRQRIKT